MSRVRVRRKARAGHQCAVARADPRESANFSRQRARYGFSRVEQAVKKLDAARTSRPSWTPTTRPAARGGWRPNSRSLPHRRVAIDRSSPERPPRRACPAEIAYPRPRPCRRKAGSECDSAVPPRDCRRRRPGMLGMSTGRERDAAAARDLERRGAPCRRRAE